MPRRRMTKEVIGTPLVEITVSAGVIIVIWANLHRKCNARGPMDKASAYGAEDSRFDPWRACKLQISFPRRLFKTDSRPFTTGTRCHINQSSMALVADSRVAGSC